MRRYFIVALLVLLAGAGLAVLMERGSGYVLVSSGLTTVETSFWVGLVLLVLFNVLLFLLWRLLGRLLASRRTVRGWLDTRADSRRLAQLQADMAAGKYAQVAGTLGGPDKLGVEELRLLMRARCGQGNWAAVIKLLPWLRRRRVLDRRELDDLAFRAYSGSLVGKGGNPLKQAWSDLPSKQRRQTALVDIYSRLLIASGEDAEAETLLNRALKRQWDGRLVGHYGRLRPRDPARSLKRAEKWLAAHPGDAKLMLCLGRLSLRNELWGKARDYLESSHRLVPDAETCAELARLLFSLGKREKSAQHYREGLLLREANLPNLPQPKQPQSAPRNP